MTSVIHSISWQFSPCKSVFIWNVFHDCEHKCTFKGISKSIPTVVKQENNIIFSECYFFSFLKVYMKVKWVTGGHIEPLSNTLPLLTLARILIISMLLKHFLTAIDYCGVLLKLYVFKESSVKNNIHKQKFFWEKKKKITGGLTDFFFHFLLDEKHISPWNTLKGTVCDINGNTASILHPWGVSLHIPQHYSSTLLIS